MLPTTDQISVFLKLNQNPNTFQGKSPSSKILEEKKDLVKTLDQVLDGETSIAGRLKRLIFIKNPETFETSHDLPLCPDGLSFWIRILPFKTRNKAKLDDGKTRIHESFERIASKRN